MFGTARSRAAQLPLAVLRPMKTQHLLIGQQLNLTCAVSGGAPKDPWFFLTNLTDLNLHAFIFARQLLQYCTALQ